MKLFWRAFLLPFVLFYALFFAYVSLSKASIFGRNRWGTQFRRDYIFGGLTTPIPDAELVILGESGAKFGLDPRMIGRPYSVNLAALSGNALHAFETMNSYYAHRKPPACVVFISNFEWKRSHQDFLGLIIDSDQLALSELRDLWRESRARALYPADRYSFFEFWGTYLLSHLRLRPLFISRLQLPPAPLARWTKGIQRVEQARGHEGRDIQTAPADQFFQGATSWPFLRPFEPSASEDHYLLKLARLTQDHGTRLWLGSLPVAESPLGTQSEEFRRTRDEHLHALLAGFDHVRWLSLPATAPIKYFWDFTHLNSAGADLATQSLKNEIGGECYSWPE